MALLTFQKDFALRVCHICTNRYISFDWDVVALHQISQYAVTEPLTLSCCASPVIRVILLPVGPVFIYNTSRYFRMIIFHVNQKLDMGMETVQIINLVLEQLLPSIQLQFSEWSHRSFEQFLAEFYAVLLEEHVALEMLKVRIYSSLLSP
jgi:hypothetical protein